LAQVFGSNRHCSPMVSTDQGAPSDLIRWSFDRLVRSYHEYDEDPDSRPLQGFVDEMLMVDQQDSAPDSVERPRAAPEHPLECIYVGKTSAKGKAQKALPKKRAHKSSSSAVGAAPATTALPSAEPEDRGPVPGPFAMSAPSRARATAAAEDAEPTAEDKAAWLEYYRQCAEYFRECTAQLEGNGEPTVENPPPVYAAPAVPTPMVQAPAMSASPGPSCAPATHCSQGLAGPNPAWGPRSVAPADCGTSSVLRGLRPRGAQQCDPRFAQACAPQFGHPAGPMPGAHIPPVGAVGGPLGQSGEEEELANLLSAWYFSGYYTGLYAGRQGR